MSFTVVYDASVPYPNTLRDLLLRIAQSPAHSTRAAARPRQHVPGRAAAAACAGSGHVSTRRVKVVIAAQPSSTVMAARTGRLASVLMCGRLGVSAARSASLR
jgi:hypothetical protein